MQEARLGLYDFKPFDLAMLSQNITKQYIQPLLPSKDTVKSTTLIIYRTTRESSRGFKEDPEDSVRSP